MKVNAEPLACPGAGAGPRRPVEVDGFRRLLVPNLAKSDYKSILKEKLAVAMPQVERSTEDSGASSRQKLRIPILHGITPVCKNNIPSKIVYHFAKLCFILCGAK